MIRLYEAIIKDYKYFINQSLDYIIIIIIVNSDYKKFRKKLNIKYLYLYILSLFIIIFKKIIINKQINL